MREQLRTAALLIGAAVLALGIGMIYTPAGVIAAGALLVAGAVLDGYDDEGSGDRQ